MADNKTVYQLDIDVSGTKVDSAAKALEALKKRMIETQLEIKKLKLETKGSGEAQVAAAGQFSQLETKLKGISVEYQKVQRESLGVQSFTEKIGTSFKESLGPIEGMLSKLGPLGGAFGSLVGQVDGISNAMSGLFNSTKKGGDGLDNLAKTSSQTASSTKKAEKGVDDLSDSMDQVTPSTKKAEKGLDDLNDAAKDISSSAPKVVDGIEDITVAIDDIGDSAKGGISGLDELTKFTDKTAGSAEGASKGIGGLIGGLGPVAAVAGIAVGAIAALGAELFDLAGEMEIIDRKARVVFGDAFPKIEAAAKANANAIGLTTGEYLKLASSQQLVFDSLGLTADQTAELTPRLLELADGLADFSAGQLDTAQAAELLVKATQGQTEGLAQFGIAVKYTQEDLKRLSAEFVATGLYTQSQADSLANLELAFTTVGKKVEEFSAGQETLQDKADKSSAKFREAKESLAVALIPALTTATDIGTSFVGTLESMISGSKGLKQQLLDLASFGATGFGGSIVKSLVDVTFGFGEAEDQIEKTKAANEAYANSIDGTVNAETVQAASTEKLIAKQKQLNDSRDAFAKQGKNGVAQEIQGELDLIDLEINKRKESASAAQAAAEAKGESYEQLQKKLADLNTELKKYGENETDEIARNKAAAKEIKERLKVFEDGAAKQTKMLSAAQQANQTYAKSLVEISLAYDLSNAKIAQATEAGFLDQADAQRMLLDLEVATAQARLSAKETFAKADGKLTQDEQANILLLSAALDKSKKAVAEYVQAIEKGVKDREAEINIKLVVADAEFDKIVADAISTDTLIASFDDVFANVANNFGADVREQLIAAAQDGTISFEGLAANIDLSGNAEDIASQKQAIAELQSAYEQYQLELAKNDLEVVSAEDIARLDQLRKKLTETRTELEQLKSEQDRNIALGIDVKQEDLDKIASLEQDVTTLTDEAFTVSLIVEADTKALDDLNAKVDEAKSPKGDAEEKSAGLLASFGLDSETSQFVIGAAQELAATISDVFLSAQRARNAAILDDQLQASQQLYDANLEDLDASLERGAITQEQYDRRREEAEKENEKRKEAAAKAAFLKEQRAKRAQATINFGLELAGLAAAAPQAGIAAPLFYGVQAGLAAARYTTNLALIGQAKFAQGGIVKLEEGGTATATPSDSSGDISSGTILSGPSHSEGGVKAIVGKQRSVELEGGEAVINVKSTKMFAPILSRINAHNGWGKAFAEGGVVAPSVPHAFAMGGITPSVPQVFATGGQVSLIPSESIIANRRQLEESTRVEERPIKLQGEREEKQTVLYISDLESKQNRRNRSADSVSYGG